MIHTYHYIYAYRQCKALENFISTGRVQQPGGARGLAGTPKIRPNGSYAEWPSLIACVSRKTERFHFRWIITERLCGYHFSGIDIVGSECVFARRLKATPPYGYIFYLYFILLHLIFSVFITLHYSPILTCDSQEPSSFFNSVIQSSKTDLCEGVH